MPFNNTRTSSKARQLATIAFLTAANLNYDNNQRISRKKKQNESKPTDKTFWTRWSELLFLEMSAKMNWRQWKTQPLIEQSSLERRSNLTKNKVTTREYELASV